jgi:hypothetical protein
MCGNVLLQTAPPPSVLSPMMVLLMLITMAGAGFVVPLLIVRRVSASSVRIGGLFCAFCDSPRSALRIATNQNCSAVLQMHQVHTHQIAADITTNEAINSTRYPYLQKDGRFHNPFDR